MDKYTLKTIFERSFSGVIWRIEADTTGKMLAIESRALGDGIPAFSAIRYADGQMLAEERPYGGRQWTLAGIADGCILVRAFGEREPNAPGIACLSATTGEVRWERFNHTFIAMDGGAVRARPRHIASGYDTYLSVRDGTPQGKPLLSANPATQAAIELPAQSSVTDGISASYAVEGAVHRLAFGDKEARAFHVADGDGFAVKLIISQQLLVLEERTIMRGMAKMSPEIFFAIGRQLFFIDGNKEKIVSYLV